MWNAAALFEDAIQWLRDNYNEFRFFAERDVVWTIQSRLIGVIQDGAMEFGVFNDYPMMPGKRRSLSAGLVITDCDGHVQVASEFKYEPCHARNDVLSHKFPVVFWGKEGVAKDVERIRQFVDSGRTPVAFSVFIDEGSYFRHRDPHTRSRWIDWGMRGSPPCNVSVLWSQAAAAET